MAKANTVPRRLQRAGCWWLSSFVVRGNCGDAWWMGKVRGGLIRKYCQCKIFIWRSSGIDSTCLQVQCLTMRLCVSNCDTNRGVEPPAKSCVTDMAARGFGEFRERAWGQGDAPLFNVLDAGFSELLPMSLVIDETVAKMFVPSATALSVEAIAAPLRSAAPLTSPF